MSSVRRAGVVRTAMSPQARRVAGIGLLGLVVVLVGLLPGCGGSDPEGLRFALQSEASTLDPRFVTDAVSTRLSRLVHEPLVDFDERFRPVPALARWSVPEPTRYRFEIRPDARFHDGGPVTAGDVAAT